MGRVKEKDVMRRRKDSMGVSTDRILKDAIAIQYSLKRAGRI